jgi:hypothetical protein
LKTVYSKYRVEFGTSSGLMGVYIGDTIEDLHEAIDNDKRLAKYEKTHDFASILKYGYFWEFKDKPFETKDYVMDNCMHFMWTVKGTDKKEPKTISELREQVAIKTAPKHGLLDLFRRSK